jgi:hypothetical protein
MVEAALGDARRRAGAGRVDDGTKAIAAEGVGRWWFRSRQCGLCGHGGKE